ncbi:hypothetical protein T265_11419 [Opisthorchis viverrini]|uniref:Uncharacterized protein n=1 Tax=Opisthorchis viverrini TaxID=6198 RepID=A0A074YYQ8_OPIVI|nr:hypothetical protein T265_11419 [Opisthorchis viverrini]KER19931.1 hypothetical protein T265_11419 [Opisthorchis viverrini]
MRLVSRNRPFSRVFLKFDGYLLTTTQLQTNTAEQFHKFHNKPHLPIDARRNSQKATSVASSVTSAVAPSFLTDSGSVPPFTWLYVKNSLRKSVDWLTQHVAKQLQPMRCDQFIYRDCSTLSAPNCHATQRKHEGWDTARLLKSRQENSRGRYRVRTTDLLVCKFVL